MINTLWDQYIKPLEREKAHDAQRAAVLAYLQEYGEISRDYAYMTGLKPCGRIKNLGARICELRQEGMQIETEERGGSCWYVLKK